MENNWTVFPRRRSRRHRRDGFTLLELLVSATLLIALISIVVPLTVRANRVWQDARCYRMAVHELSNQLEDLTLMDDEARQQALSNWQPDSGLLHALPDVKLTGETIADGDGKRIKVSLAWRRPYGAAAPLSMMGWVHPPSDRTRDDSTEAKSTEKESPGSVTK